MNYTVAHNFGMVLIYFFTWMIIKIWFILDGQSLNLIRALLVDLYDFL